VSMAVSAAHLVRVPSTDHLSNVMFAMTIACPFLHRLPKSCLQASHEPGTTHNMESPDTKTTFRPMTAKDELILALHLSQSRPGRTFLQHHQLRCSATAPIRYLLAIRSLHTVSQNHSAALGTVSSCVPVSTQVCALANDRSYQPLSSTDKKLSLQFVSVVLTLMRQKGGYSIESATITTRSESIEFRATESITTACFVACLVPPHMQPWREHQPSRL